MNAQITSVRPGAGSPHPVARGPGSTRPRARGPAADHEAARTSAPTRRLVRRLRASASRAVRRTTTRRSGPTRSSTVPPPWIRVLFVVREVVVRAVGIEPRRPTRLRHRRVESRRGPARHGPGTPRLPRVGARRARPGRAQHRRPAPQPARTGLLGVGPAHPSVGGARDAGAGGPQAGGGVMSADTATRAAPAPVRLVRRYPPQRRSSPRLPLRMGHLDRRPPQRRHRGREPAARAGRGGLRRDRVPGARRAAQLGTPAPGLASGSEVVPARRARTGGAARPDRPGQPPCWVRRCRRPTSSPAGRRSRSPSWCSSSSSASGRKRAGRRSPRRSCFAVTAWSSPGLLASAMRIFWHLPLMLSGDLPWAVGIARQRRVHDGDVAPAGRQRRALDPGGRLARDAQRRGQRVPLHDGRRRGPGPPRTCCSSCVYVVVAVTAYALWRHRRPRLEASTAPPVGVDVGRLDEGSGHVDRHATAHL